MIAYYRCRCGYTFDHSRGEHGCPNCTARRAARLVTPKPMARSNPLKPGTKRMKSRHRAIGSANKAEQVQQDAQRAHGCAMCLLLGFKRDACGSVRVHHRTIGDLHGNPQIGQHATVGLGDWHHQGVLMARYPTRDAMRERFGPSLHHHKRAFLELIAERLGERSTSALQAWQDAQIATKEAAWLT